MAWSDRSDIPENHTITLVYFVRTAFILASGFRLASLNGKQTSASRYLARSIQSGQVIPNIPPRNWTTAYSTVVTAGSKLRFFTESILTPSLI